MKKSYFLGLLLLIFGYSFSQTVAVRGTVAAVAEPCLEEPCLPGIVYAIETDSVNYIITLQGLWIWADEPLIIETHSFSINDPISVKGLVSVKQDIYGDDFTEI